MRNVLPQISVVLVTSRNGFNAAWYERLHTHVTETDLLKFPELFLQLPADYDGLIAKSCKGHSIVPIIFTSPATIK